MDPQTRHAAIRRGFRDNEIDAAVLPSLTDEGLKDLGIASVGRRHRLLGEIAGPKPKAAKRLRSRGSRIAHPRRQPSTDC